MPVLAARGPSEASLTRRSWRDTHLSGRLAFFLVGALLVLVAEACGEAEEGNLPPEGTSAPVTTPVAPQDTGLPVITPASPNTLSGIVVNTLPTPDGATVSDHFAVTNLAKSTAPVSEYSPDGASSFSITGSGLTVTFDGTQRNVQPKVVSAVWAPDSQSLAVVVYDTPITSSRQELPVYMISADGSEKREIATTTVPGALQFLADGTLAYQFEGELHLLDMTTGNDRVGATGLDTDPTNDDPYLLSPDRAAVALLHGRTLSVLDFASGSVTELTMTVDFRRWGSYAWWSSDVLVYSDLARGDMPRVFSFDMKMGTTTQLLSTTRRGAYSEITPTTSGGWLLYVYRDKGNQVEPGALYEGVNLYTGQQSALFKWGLGLRLIEQTSEIWFSRTTGSPEDMGGWVATVSY